MFPDLWLLNIDQCTTLRAPQRLARYQLIWNGSLGRCDFLTWSILISTVLKFLDEQVQFCYCCHRIHASLQLRFMQQRSKLKSRRFWTLICCGIILRQFHYVSSLYHDILWLFSPYRQFCMSTVTPRRKPLTGQQAWPVRSPRWWRHDLWLAVRVEDILKGSQILLLTRDLSKRHLDVFVETPWNTTHCSCVTVELCLPLVSSTSSTPYIDWAIVGTVNR